MSIKIKMDASGPVDYKTLMDVNYRKNQGMINSQNVSSLNRTATEPLNSQPSAPQQPVMQQQPVSPQPVMQQQPVSPQPVMQQQPVAPQPVMQQQPVQPQPVAKPVPALVNQVQKGQKVNISSQSPLNVIKASFGWNSTNAACDADVSAFMLGDNGKVLGDDWFVFYGQTDSPDHSTQFANIQGEDREVIQIDVRKLNPVVKKIVFVLTINEALEKNLNFSMMKDAYVRIFNGESNEQLVSFQLSDYYANVTSMMIGEVYLHNGSWKFNAIGNGVARDLAGLCEFYGVVVQ